MAEHRITVLTSHALLDPLTQGLTLYFLDHCPAEGRTFDLITFETSRYAISYEDESRVKVELMSRGIDWHPMRYVDGSLLRPSRLLNVVGNFFRAGRIIRQTNPSCGLAICAPAGGALHLLTLFRKKMPIAVYAFEPHAEMMAELGVWNRTGLKYLITHALERSVAKRARHLLTGTHAMIERLRNMGTQAVLHHVPTGSDEKLFVFSEASRQKLRLQWGVEERTVITYVGKFGGLYLGRELIQFFGALHRADPALYFLVLTPNDHGEVSSWFEQEGVPRNDFMLALTNLEDLPAWLSASDVGVVAYADVPSRKYCSPTKVGNYLMCGLPFIVQEATSEDDTLVNEFGTGIVVRDFSASGAEEVVTEIRQLMSRDKSELRATCRRAGLEKRGNQLAADVIRDVLNEFSGVSK